MKQESAKILEFPKKNEKAVAAGGSLSIGGIAGFLAYLLASPIVQSIGGLVTIIVITIAGVTLTALSIFQLKSSIANQKAIEYLSEELQNSNKLTDALAQRILDSKVSNLIAPKLSASSFEVYLAYEKLRADDFSEIIKRMEGFYRCVYALQYGDTFYNSKKDSLNNGLIEQAESLFKVRPEDRLYVSFVQTGESIRFHIKTGWTPSIGTKDGDIDIGVPRGALSAGLSVFLLNTAFNHITSNINEVLDIAIKEQQIELNQQNIEMNHLSKEKMELETQKLRHELKHLKEKVSESKHEAECLQKEFQSLISVTMLNDEITTISVRSGYALNK
ncbi:MAG: hypothetical protein JAZ17_04125 [Candidatus Thiodiazotropha endolucinida]|nr:hypothetical protein [Candidatus Thiodiazotropha endolucinida]